ncbi:hypothetical protein [uncultured Nocardioides sp.]|jgi:hypothetical protein|uniref:hypothetical protein n=1 Tax=uncultured Nocardioides sp. TaxID=198441 RepID=UPI00260662D5|nr:hypothetical protein [uncultured Nocardioides sp.]HRD59393.1 hypothetical protein [Nocardioides sp.]
MPTLTYYRTAERPAIKLWLLDDDGTLIDFSTGYTFEFKLGRPGAAATLTKTTGITGAAGSGTETSGTPNVNVSFTAGELDALVPKGNTTWQLRTTTGGVDRVWQGPFKLLDVIS